LPFTINILVSQQNWFFGALLNSFSSTVKVTTSKGIQTLNFHYFYDSGWSCKCKHNFLATIVYSVCLCFIPVRAGWCAKRKAKNGKL